MSEQSGDSKRVEPGHQVPAERSRFRELLAANPNYFGNLPGSDLPQVVELAVDTTYEEVTCVGLNLALEQLEATVSIKRALGYGGGLCGAGSTEYVRFYLDYGAGWTDAGLVAFGAHDIPTRKDCAGVIDRPLTYAVTLSIEPRSSFCFFPVLPNVRAILSWNVAPPPATPGWMPTWGNVRDQHVQVPARHLVFGDVVALLGEAELAKLPPQLAEAQPDLPIPMPDPPPVTLRSLAHEYREHGVPAHRYGFASLRAAVAGPGDQAAMIASHAEWKQAGLDLAGALAALDQTSGNVEFEQLDCVGLDNNLDRLVATLRIKRPSGYAGGLCSFGSTEYVAFWADWSDSCQWTYLGTTGVTVHDIGSLPADGLAYSAVLPVDLDAVRRPCDTPVVARIRAVLSWNAPPSTTDPSAVPFWGNRLDTHVQVEPGTSTGTGPTISSIGNVVLKGIDVFSTGLTNAGAKFVDWGTMPDAPYGRTCPFGGVIFVKGAPRLGSKYRVMQRVSGQTGPGTPVVDPIPVVDWMGNASTVTPDPTTGWVAYLDTLANMSNLLAHWTPAGDDLMELMLEMASPGGVPEGSTPWYRVQLDNTAPRRRPAPPPFVVTCDISIDTGGCKDYEQGDTVKGHFVAQDAHFGAFSLTTLPSSLNPNEPVAPATPATSETKSFALGGDEWTLDTTGMDTCGYVVTLQISDRSIVGSNPYTHNYNFTDVGFCLRQKTT